MPLRIVSQEEQTTMAKYTVKERLYYTEDKTRVVPEGHPDARFLFAPAGRQILEETARAVGLLAGEEADAEANEESPDEASAGDVVAEVQAPESSAGDVVVESVTAEPQPTPAEPTAEAPVEGHVCPDCGKVCKTQFGLNSHRSAKHG